ncbi:hypothetical protein B0T24DRAFT_4204 [Lasiosphaeria ovina]|uniref:Uncharacterized protein n=1 Tax=Lasiosphaeria ovina TaxID=92902 RepID=A0AAE0NIN7_9PEZI|nr:hypothetical protein B0T24DRAFT_4204 [Lasiosphaeria ovina]
MTPDDGETLERVMKDRRGVAFAAVAEACPTMADPAVLAATVRTYQHQILGLIHDSGRFKNALSINYINWAMDRRSRRAIFPAVLSRRPRWQYLANSWAPAAKASLDISSPRNSQIVWQELHTATRRATLVGGRRTVGHRQAQATFLHSSISTPINPHPANRCLGVAPLSHYLTCKGASRELHLLGAT